MTITQKFEGWATEKKEKTKEFKTRENKRVQNKPGWIPKNIFRKKEVWMSVPQMERDEVWELTSEMRA